MVNPTDILGARGQEASSIRQSFPGFVPLLLSCFRTEECSRPALALCQTYGYRILHDTCQDQRCSTRNSTAHVPSNLSTPKFRYDPLASRLQSCFDAISTVVRVKFETSHSSLGVKVTSEGPRILASSLKITGMSNGTEFDAVDQFPDLIPTLQGFCCLAGCVAA